MKKAVNIISISVHSLYFLWCIAGIIICVIYRYNYSTDFGRSCAYLALDVYMWAVVSLILVVPILLTVNILSSVFSKTKKERIVWIVVSSVSPIALVIFALIAIVVFVGTTGGV